MNIQVRLLTWKIFHGVQPYMAQCLKTQKEDKKIADD